MNSAGRAQLLSPTAQTHPPPQADPHLWVVARRLQQLHAVLVVPQRAGRIPLGTGAVAQAAADGAQAAAKRGQGGGIVAAARGLVATATLLQLRLRLLHLLLQVGLAEREAVAGAGHVAGAQGAQAELQQEGGAAALARHALGRLLPAAALQIPDAVSAGVRLDIAIHGGCCGCCVGVEEGEGQETCEAGGG